MGKRSERVQEKLIQQTKTWWIEKIR